MSMSHVSDPPFNMCDEVCDDPQPPHVEALHWRVGSRLCELIGPVPGDGCAQLYVLWRPSAPQPGELSLLERDQYVLGRDRALRHLVAEIDNVLIRGRALH